MVKDMAYYSNEMNEYGEIAHEEDIICPYCFTVQEDIFEIKGAYEEGEYTTNCGHCENEFKFETQVDITYTTKPLESEEDDAADKK